MQYSHGICEATASPISSLVFGSSLVVVDIWNDFMLSQNAGSIPAGIFWKNCGTKPNVFSMSLSVAARLLLLLGAGACCCAVAVPTISVATIANDPICDGFI